MGEACSPALHSAPQPFGMGTAFITCTESGAHANYKKGLLGMREDATVITWAFPGKTGARDSEPLLCARLRKRGSASGAWHETRGDQRVAPDRSERPW